MGSLRRQSGRELASGQQFDPPKLSGNHVSRPSIHITAQIFAVMSSEYASPARTETSLNKSEIQISKSLPAVLRTTMQAGEKKPKNQNLNSGKKRDCASAHWLLNRENPV